MSFRTNSFQQMSMFDSTYGLTEREKKALDRSWARIFADDVFPQIDEKRFAVLYSDKASRPNTPVNVIVGALIIKELFGISDDEVVDNLMLDPIMASSIKTESGTVPNESDMLISYRRIHYVPYQKKLFCQVQNRSGP